MKKFFAVMLTVVLMLLVSIAIADPAMVTLSDTGITATATGTTVNGSTLTITAPGEYIISGSLSDGQILVKSENEGKITLYLNGVSIHNNTGAAILVLDASPRVTISMMEGTENKLSGGAEYVYDKDDEPNGVIFSRCDMTLSGEGALIIDAAIMDGIVSKDDLRIKSGVYTINAARHGIRGKDYVEITGGTFTIVAGQDGIRSTNSKVREEGYVSISDAAVTIVCGDDPISAVTAINIQNTAVSATIVTDKKD